MGHFWLLTKFYISFPGCFRYIKLQNRGEFRPRLQKAPVLRDCKQGSRLPHLPFRACGIGLSYIEKGVLRGSVISASCSVLASFVLHPLDFWHCAESSTLYPNGLLPLFFTSHREVEQIFLKAPIFLLLHLFRYNPFLPLKNPFYIIRYCE